MAHVFQYQHGVDTVEHHYRNIKEHPNHSEAYEYTRADVEKGFGLMNTEQQARFVDNLYLLKLCEEKDAAALLFRCELQLQDMGYAEAMDIWQNFRANTTFG